MKMKYFSMASESSLLLLILAVYSCNIVVARRCESTRGYQSKECSDDDFCCEKNGEAKCCTAAELWWVWLIISVSFSVLIPLVIVTGVLCCVFCCTSKRKGNSDAIQSPRAVEQSSNNGDINLTTIFKQPYSSSNSSNHTYLDAPPSYSDVSKTVQKLPPPYPGT